MRGAACCALALAALSSGPAPGAETIEELIVHGRLEETLPMQLARYGNRVEVIDAEQLALGGFHDLGQSLQMLVPGLYLAAKNGAFDYVGCSLQGSRCQDILWLVDGVRINNRLYNTTSPLDTIPAHMVERIEVLYGGQGIFYGTQSVAGVVNVVTKGFSDAAEGSVHAAADGNEGTHVAADYRAGWGGHRFVLYGSVDRADGFKPFSSDDYQPSGTDRERGYDVATAGIRYGTALSEDARLTVLYHHGANRVEFAAPALRARSYNERDEDLLTVKLDYRVNDRTELFAKAYLHDWDSRFTQRDHVLDPDGRLTGTIETVSDAEYWGYRDYGATAMARINSRHGLQYTVGYDHQRYSGRDDVLLIDDRTESVDAVFAQVATTPVFWEGTAVAAGMRHSRPSGVGDITVWNLSGRRELGRGYYARATVGTSFRAPDAWQLYGNDPCCALGNPDLEGEKSRNLNAAVGGRLELAAGLDWEVVGFLREVDGLIGSADGRRINTGEAVDFRGMEVTVNLSIAGGVSVGLDYLLSRAEAEGTSEQIDGVPEELAKANLTYQGADVPYELSLSVVRVGDVYGTVAGGIGRREHGNYTVADVGAAWYLGASRRHRMSLRLENVTDARYASSLGRAFRDADGGSYAYRNLGTPRTWHVGYRYRF